MAEKNRNVAKASIGYTLGNYLIKGISFITVPIFSRILSTSDFGIYNTFIAYEQILYIFICLGLHASLKNANLKFPGKIDEYTSSVAVFPFVIHAILLIVSFLFRGFLSEVLNLPEIVIPMLITYSYCSGLVILYQQRIALDYNYSGFIKVSGLNALLNVGSSIILIIFVFDKDKYLGRIVGGTAAYVIIAIIVICILYNHARPTLNTGYIRYGLRISLPIIPHGLAQILLMQFDRIMINSVIGSSEAGLYSFAYTIYALIQITTTSLDTVFSPWTFKKLKDNKIHDVIRVGTSFMLFISGLVSTVMILSPEIIKLLGGEKYTKTFNCVLPVLFAGFFSMSYCIPAVIEYYFEKTKYIAMGTSIAALLNIILNYIFIPKFGYVAAAYTTLFSYIVYFFLHCFVSKKLCGYFIIKPIFLIIGLGFVIASFVLSFLFCESIFSRIVAVITIDLVGCYIIAHVYGIQGLKNAIQSLFMSRR